MTSEKYNTIKELGLWLWLRWHLASKEKKAKMVLSKRDIDPREFVTVKCNNCGEKICFNPTTVLLPPECKCGNKDSGDCRNWLKGDFGNFKLVQIYTLRFPTYEDIRRRLSN